MERGLQAKFGQNEDLKITVNAEDPDGNNRWLSTQVSYAGVPQLITHGSEIIVRPQVAAGGRL